MGPYVHCTVVLFEDSVALLIIQNLKMIIFYLASKNHLFILIQHSVEYDLLNKISYWYIAFFNYASNLYFCVRSRTMVPRPEDTAAGVRILRKICYPRMNRFIDFKQEMGNSLLDNYTRRYHQKIIIY